MLRFHVPLIEPDVRISRIRLSDKNPKLAAHGLPASFVASRGVVRGFSAFRGVVRCIASISPAVASFDAALK